ncbi:MAG TPA: lipoprotein signal peptidase [Flavobacteriales bacterium]|nr:lipoprotein signal peptidase [Flavobacteriales bacterium]
MKRAALIILLVLLADQTLKIWVKTHFNLGESVPEYSADGKSYLHFIENPGMAFGMSFGGESGKLVLTLLRIVAVIAIGFGLRSMLRNQATTWQLASVALVFAGALGNIIDSTFYGLLFDKGSVWDPVAGRTVGYDDLAVLNFSGYTGIFHGSVVDMFYFPLWRGYLPEWLPFVGGKHFEFFEPVFNIADASITVGIGLFILTHRKKRREEPTIIAEGIAPTEAPLEAPANVV